MQALEGIRILDLSRLLPGPYCTMLLADFGAEAVAAEQTQANEMVLNVHDEELGDYRQLGFAMKLSKTPAQLRKRAPRLGEDTEAVLGEV